MPTRYVESGVSLRFADGSGAPVVGRGGGGRRCIVNRERAAIRNGPSARDGDRPRSAVPDPQWAVVVEVATARGSAVLAVARKDGLSPATTAH